MYIITSDRNALKSACDMFCLYDINCGLDVLIDGIWSIAIVGWVGAIVIFWWIHKSFGLMSLWNGIQRLVGFWLTNE